MTRIEVINNQIDEIMDTFDFEEVRKVMTFLDWEWADCNGVPEDYELRKSARKTMKHLIRFEDGGASSSGGFTATLKQGVSGSGKWLRVDLAFCVEQTLLDGEDYE